MVEVIYTEHLQFRLKLRKIPNDFPQKIFQEPEQQFYDTIEDTFIAIKKLYYNGKPRNMMIAYEKKKIIIQIITIHPITDEKIINRVINNRWIRK